MKTIMETVEIDKKIASLKEEIEELEKQKNNNYKKVGDYWLGKYVTDGYGKYYIYDVEASLGGISCDTVIVYVNGTYKNFIIDHFLQFFEYDSLTEITKEEFAEEFEKCISIIKDNYLKNFNK